MKGFDFDPTVERSLVLGVGVVGRRRGSVMLLSIESKPVIIDKK